MDISGRLKSIVVSVKYIEIIGTNATLYQYNSRISAQSNGK